MQQRYFVNENDPRAKGIPRSWAPAIEHYLATLKVAQLSHKTIRTRCQQLRLAARTLKVPPHEVTAGAVFNWCAAADWSQETRRSIYRTLQRFFAVVAPGRNPADGLPTIAASVPSPSPIPDEAFYRAVEEADARVALILLLAGQAGLRRAEISRIHRRDLLRSDSGWWLLVKGKGAKQRTVPVGDGLAAMLLAYEGWRDGWLFPGKIEGHLSPEHVGQMGTAALRPYHLHQCRHRFATVTFARSHNLLAVQQLLGHTSPATTQRYVAVARDELRNVAMHAM